MRHPKRLPWTLAVLILLALAALTLAPAAAQGDHPQPVVAVYPLSDGAQARWVIEGPGGVWIREHIPLGLARIAPAAPSTGDPLPVTVQTVTLSPVTHTLTVVDLSPLPATFHPVSVTVEATMVVTVSPGIVEYRWPTTTLQGRLMTPPGAAALIPAAAETLAWLGLPAAGTLQGAPGLWAQRSGSLDFLDPATGQITRHESAAYTNFAWSYLNNEVPGVVWGAGPRLTALYPVSGTAVAIDPLGWPTDIAYSTPTTMWHGDGSTGGLVRLSYTYPDPQATVRAWLFPDHRAPTAFAHGSLPGQLWYLDELNGEVGQCTYDETGGVIRVYRLPTATVPYDKVGYDGRQLWFVLTDTTTGQQELAAFDTTTATLTRYQPAGGLPAYSQSGAPGWATRDGAAYQVRWQLYLPLVVSDWRLAISDWRLAIGDWLTASSYW